MNMQSRGKKAKLFSAATKLFLEKGYQATSIADLAAEVGMLKGSLYYYIQTKDDLLCQVLLEALESAEANLLGEVDRSENPDDIQTRIADHFAYLAQNHVGLALLLREADQLPRARRTAIKIRVEQYERIFAATLRAGQCCGVVADGDPSALAKVMLAASTWASWGDRDSKRESVLNDGVLRLILNPDVSSNSERTSFTAAKAVNLVRREAMPFDSSPGLLS